MVFALLIVVDFLVHLGKIHYGLKVGELKVGGLTPQEAENLLSLSYQKVLKEPVKIKYKNKTWLFYPDEVRLKINLKDTVQKAFYIGREGNILKKIIRRLSLYREPISISVTYQLDKKRVEKRLRRIAQKVNCAPQNATLKIKGTSIKILPSKIGFEVDYKKAYAALVEKMIALKKKQFDLPVNILPAKVSEADAKKMITEIKMILSSPLIFKYDKYSWKVEPEEIGRWIEFEVDPILKPIFNKEKFKKHLSKFTDEFRIEPKDAEFKVKGERVEIEPSRDGKEIDLDAAYKELYKIVKMEPPREIILNDKLVAPKLSTEEARAMGIKERISSYTTSFNPRQTNRVNNIHLLARALDGSIIAPGEVFSVNKKVGPRTAEKGYKEAPVIINGELVPSIGGGACQVGTTLFNAVFFAGFPVIERTNHSFYISHYPPGRDATLSYGSLDLKFRNDTPAYVLLKAWYSKSTVTFAFYGTDFGTEVSYRTSPFTNFKPFKVEYIDDPNLPLGQEKIKDRGIEGRDITVYRIVKRKGVIVRKDKFFSRYRPKKELVLRGTKVVSGTAETTFTPSLTETTFSVGD